MGNLRWLAFRTAGNSAGDRCYFRVNGMLCAGNASWGLASRRKLLGTVAQIGGVCTYS